MDKKIIKLAGLALAGVLLVSACAPVNKEPVDNEKKQSLNTENEKPVTGEKIDNSVNADEQVIKDAEEAETKRKEAEANKIVADKAEPKTIAEVKAFIKEKGVDNVTLLDFEHLSYENIGSGIIANAYKLEDGELLLTVGADNKIFAITLIDKDGNEESLKNDNIPNEEDQKGTSSDDVKKAEAAKQAAKKEESERNEIKNKAVTKTPKKVEVDKKTVANVNTEPVKDDYINDNDQKEDPIVNTEPVKDDYINDNDQKEDSAAAFDKKLQARMQNDLSNLQVTLVYGYNETKIIPKDTLTAIKRWNNDYAWGYAVKYGTNKIGFLYRIPEAATQSATLFANADASSKIKNNTPSEFLQYADVVIENGKQ